MIVPPGTNCPPNALKPNRCALESRPFREVPCPFLCAIANPLIAPASGRLAYFFFFGAAFLAADFFTAAFFLAGALWALATFTSSVSAEAAFFGLATFLGSSG